MRQVQAADVSEAEIQNKRCLECHGESRITTLDPRERLSMVDPTSATPEMLAKAPARRPELLVPVEKLRASSHKATSCVSCHPDARTLPHAWTQKAATCDTAKDCHLSEAAKYRAGSHAAAAARGEKNAPTCGTCHGDHEIPPKSDRNSRVFPLNVVKMCGGCHEQHVGKTPSGADAALQVSKYLDSVHGRAVTKAGLTVAATCADCHGPHDALPSSNPMSPVNRTHIADTCGRCHVGISEVYNKSVHGELLAKGGSDAKDAPVCSGCHSAHEITRTDSPAFTRDIVAECGTCHNKPAPGSKEKASLYDTYRASYHGQVTNLGSSRAARCSDCHGAHNIKRVNAADSPLNAAHKLATCQKCHKGAPVKFASFAPHADFRNSDRYPVLHYVYLYFVIMMSASFGFFGLHCVLWLGRSVRERVRGPGEWFVFFGAFALVEAIFLGVFNPMLHPRPAVEIGLRLVLGVAGVGLVWCGRMKHGPWVGPPKPTYANGKAIQRFTRVDRINHALVIVTFFALALTGLPLLYADKAWARDLAALFGGARSCGIIHRVFALILIGNFVVHGVGVVRRFQRMGVKQMLLGPTTMLPRKKDLLDCLGMFKWFFVGGKKPKFDRWTYWEKFDYMAEVGGSGIIGLSGLLLWFPVYFSSYLPGWVFNVATIVHGFEALLAVGFIFTIHFFNAHLRLEKFPVDDVMFTGRMPEEEFQHERAVEYERMVASGEIAKLRVPAPHPWYRHFAVFVGISAMTVGTIIVVLIILAALKII